MKKEDMTPDEREFMRRIEIYGFVAGLSTSLVLGLLSLAVRLLTASN